MTITPAGFIDPYELAATLRQRAELFPRTGDIRVLPIRGPGRNGDPDDDAAFVWTRGREKWPALTAVLNQFERSASVSGEIEWGRIYFEQLMSGAIIPWTKDDTAYASRFFRTHLALRSNPLTRVYCGVASMLMIVGDVNVLGQRLPTSAINLGETPRVHLVIDFRRKDEYLDIRDPAQTSTI